MTAVPSVLLALCAAFCAGCGALSSSNLHGTEGGVGLLRSGQENRRVPPSQSLFIATQKVATALQSCLRPHRVGKCTSKCASIQAHRPRSPSALSLRASLISDKEAADDLWLEEVDSEKALSWVKERNAETLKALGDPNESELQQRILSILDSKDKIPYVTKRGKYLYNLWTDDVNPRGLWRRTTMEEFEKKEPEWETVLDIDALGKEEGESWVWAGTTRPDLGPGVEVTRLLISLSRGGSDATVTREFDLESKEFVAAAAGGFFLPEAKSSVEYRGVDELLVGTDMGEGSLTTSGYPRQVRLWKRGTPLDSAEVVFEGEVDDVSAVSYLTRHKTFRYEWRQRATSFYTSKYWVRQLPFPDECDSQLDEQEGWMELPVPEGAVVSTMGSEMLVKLREEWTAGGVKHKAGSLLAADLQTVAKEGDQTTFKVLFEPTQRRSLNGWSMTQNMLILSVLDTVKTRLQRWRWDEDTKTWEDGGMSGEGLIESLSVWAVDEDEGDEVWVQSSSYTRPPSLSITDVGETLDSPRKLLKSLPDQFDSTQLQARQFEATSTDGTKVPYFVISRKDIEADKSNPTLVYAYGGFEVSLTPSYNAVVGAAWLERGGCYVIANIRGGGEFGPDWHRAALREKRQNAYDDLFAVCSKLIDDGITSPPKLGVRGGSNGGLLAGNALVQRSDLLGAVVGEVPLLDMKRFHKLLAGSSWIAEYGDPDTKDWEYLQAYSPYHRVDRVHPGHARKMVRRLMDSKDTPTYYYENMEGGHGGAADNKQRAFMQALVYTFLSQTLGNE